MNQSTLFEKLSDSFYQQLWFLPVLFLSLAYLGRGIENSLLFLFMMSALIFFKWTKLSQQKWIAVFWLGLVISLLSSIFYHDVWGLAKKQFLIFSFASSIIVVMACYEFPIEKMRISKSQRWILMIPFFMYLARYLYFSFYHEDTFTPMLQLSAMSLAVLWPFFALVIFDARQSKWPMIFVLLLIPVFLLLKLADSRTELLMLLISSVLLLGFYYRKIIYILLTPVFLILVIFLTSRKVMTFDGNLWAWLDTISSQRLSIWKNAFTHPADNLLLGSGMNNTMAFLPDSVVHSALHNSFIELWYEAGFLGLGIWFMLMFLSLKHVVFVYHQANNRDRLIYSVFLGSLAAVIVACFFDKGYMSIYFKFFIFYLMGMLFMLGRQIKGAIKR